MSEKPKEKPELGVVEKPAPEFDKALRRSGRPIGVFESSQDFAHAQRVAKMLVVSNLMPEQFRGEQNLGSAVIVLDIAFRLKLNPLLVAQQIFLIYGKPGFSAQFAIGNMNSNADFGIIRYDLKNLGSREFEYTYRNEAKQKLTAKVTLDDWQCVAWALEEKHQKLPEGVDTLDKVKAKGIPALEGPPVSIGMAIAEGWYGKEGSKWQTMPQLMLRYRAASFFGKLYAPQLMMGLPTVEELQDMGPQLPEFTKPIFAAKAPEIVTEPPKPAQNPPESPPPAPGTPPADMPEPKAPPAAPGGDQTQEESPIKIMRDALKLAKITESRLLEFLFEIGSITNETSLEQIHLQNPTLLPMLIGQWPDILERMNHVGK